MAGPRASLLPFLLLTLGLALGVSAGENTGEPCTSFGPVASCTGTMFPLFQVWTSSAPVITKKCTSTSGTASGSFRVQLGVPTGSDAYDIGLWFVPSNSGQDPFQADFGSTCTAISYTPSQTGNDIDSDACGDIQSGTGSVLLNTAFTTLPCDRASTTSLVFRACVAYKTPSNDATCALDTPSMFSAADSSYCQCTTLTVPGNWLDQTTSTTTTRTRTSSSLTATTSQTPSTSSLTATTSQTPTTSSLTATTSQTRTSSSLTATTSETPTTSSLTATTSETQTSTSLTATTSTLSSTSGTVTSSTLSSTSQTATSSTLSSTSQTATSSTLSSTSQTATSSTLSSTSQTATTSTLSSTSQTATTSTLSSTSQTATTSTLSSTSQTATSSTLTTSSPTKTATETATTSTTTQTPAPITSTATRLALAVTTSKAVRTTSRARRTTSKVARTTTKGPAATGVFVLSVPPRARANAGPASGRVTCPLAERACALGASGGTPWRAYKNGAPAGRIVVGDLVSLRRCPRAAPQACLSVDVKGSIPFLYSATCQAASARRDLSPNWATRPPMQRFRVLASPAGANLYRLRATDGRCVGMNGQGKLLLVACASAASFSFPPAGSQTC
ncbi:hypothetical protein DFJ74DRAFT_297173 [Hyaloraphidium curvatum]|nr:hypothetical protein DFJ74DRAFT_297173 [Hyaloraphidium curvatum]